MKLSIITVNRNDADGLRRTIDSIKEQSFTNYEFIIIDGASTDDSIELIKQNEKYITHWLSEKDTGIYNAMNKGIKQSKGEYLHFLNAGDCYAHTDSIANMFASNIEASFICANFIAEHKGELKNYESYKNRDWGFSIYDIYSGDLCHQAFFIKKEIFDKYGYYNEKLKIVADWLVFFKAIGISHETVDYIDTDIVTYNMEGLSSSIGGKAIYEERKNAVKDIISPSLAAKLDRLYFLEQNSYITDNIKSCPVLFVLFRIYCRIGRIFGIVK